MSTTTTATPSGLTEDEKVIVSVVCSIAALAFLALALRFLVPVCRKKRHKKQPDDRSLFQSTQSLSNTEHQFYYSGPILPPREAKSDSGRPETSLPAPHVDSTKHSYVNTVSEEIHLSSAWGSGFDLPASRDNSREKEPAESANQPEEVSSSDEDDIQREMTGQYTRQDSSVLHRYPRQDNLEAARFARYEARQDVIREGSPRSARTGRNEPGRVYSNSDESGRINNVYDSPSRIPREVEPKMKSRNPAMRSPAQSKRPTGYIRSMNSEIGVDPRPPEVTGQPSWVGQALLMETNPKQLSAANMLRSRQYIDGAPYKTPDKEYLEWKEMKKYGHFAERGGPGTRTIYSLGKDAVRTPTLREYVTSGNMRHDTAVQAGYGHAPIVPPGGYGGDSSSYYRHRNGRDYTYTHGQPEGFVPIDSDSIPTYRPSESERQRREVFHASNRLNRELSSYLTTGSLKPLDMSSRYRENWDNEFDPHGTQERSLNHHTHPSENRLLPGEEVPSWYEAQQIQQHQEMLQFQQQQQQLNQNLSKPVKGGKGKKGKGKK